jgi:hypothetical protein
VAEALIDEEKLKDLFKTAIIEVLEERPELVGNILEEVFEDVALARAIEEGENSGSVDRNEVSKILEGRT